MMKQEVHTDNFLSLIVQISLKLPVIIILQNLQPH